MAGITSPFSAKWGKGYFENHYISNHIHAIRKAVSTETIVKTRFKRRATAVSNSIDRIKFDFSTAVARRLKPSRATAV